MKRYIKSSEDNFYEFDEEMEDYEGFDYSSDSVIPEIQKRLGVDKKIASIIYDWYAEEDAWEDFDSVKDFGRYLENDIYDMIDACDNEGLAEQVREAIDK